jgi:hypothetical protein
VTNGVDEKVSFFGEVDLLAPLDVYLLANQPDGID